MELDEQAMSGMGLPKRGQTRRNCWGGGRCRRAGRRCESGTHEGQALVR
jgi:hypothetical protein